MRSGVSLINIIINTLIIIGLIFLSYFGYTRYLDNKIKQILDSSNYFSRQAADQAQKPPADSPKEIQPNQKIITPAPAKTPAEKPIIAPVAPPGYYRNNTYFYEINFPKDWPIKVRSESNVSLGTVPPKNGRGAITIEISQGESNEVEQAKAEAKKYPGLISITEEPITLAGINGEKIIMNNFMTKIKTVNILLKKSKFNYIIKYSEESADFTNQADKALSTFKFINQ